MLANLAACGERCAVFAGLAQRREKGSCVQVGLAHAQLRLYVAAAAHNCVRREPRLAKELAENKGHVSEVLDAALNCESLRALAGLTDDACEHQELEGAAEWLYLLLRALLGHGQGCALFESATTDLDQHFTSSVHPPTT